MATRQLLAEMGGLIATRTGVEVAFESVGGVDAARRVQAGESFDVVVLASDAIDRLIGAAHLQPDLRVDLVTSGVAVAVRAGEALPDIHSEPALRAAVLEARSISYSTGPSGVALARLFDRWGISAAIQARLVQAAPGVPVGRLVACGEVELGFQQLSEMLDVEGITIVGPLPDAVQIVTTFSAGVPMSVAVDSARREAVLSMLAAMTDASMDGIKMRHGMSPVPGTYKERK